MKQELSEVKDSVEKLVGLVEKMNAGLYGDDKNGFIGVISRQHILEKEISELKKEIKEIKKVNDSQEIALTAKKNFGSKILEWIKWGALVFLVFKGALDIDNLFGKFF